MKKIDLPSIILKVPTSASPCGEHLQEAKTYTAFKKSLSLKKIAMVRETTLSWNNLK